MDMTDELTIEALADQLWGRIIGAGLNPVDLNLRAKLAIEQRLLGLPLPSFGLDKLPTIEAATYIGMQPETLQDRHKRKTLGVPEPYSIGRKLFWRRSELDAWIELQRVQGNTTVEAVSRARLRQK